MSKLEHLVRFDRMEDRLLRGGVAPRHVRCLLSELRNHFDDAVRSEMAKGLDRSAAEQAAWRRLGDEDSVVQSALAQPALRSLPARFPRLIFGSGPFILWVAAIVLTMLSLKPFFEALVAAGIVPKRPDPTWLFAPAQAAIFFYARILPVIIGTVMMIVAVRQRLSLLWPTIGVVIISLFAGATDTTLKFSTRIGEPGLFAISNNLLTLLDPITHSLGLFRPAEALGDIALGLMNIAIVFAIYYGWRRYTQLKAT